MLNEKEEKKPVPKDHWKADQKDPKSELERQHIDYKHALYRKKYGMKNEDVPTNNISGGAVSVFDPFLKGNKMARRHKPIRRRLLKKLVTFVKEEMPNPEHVFEPHVETNKRIHRLPVTKRTKVLKKIGAFIR